MNTETLKTLNIPKVVLKNVQGDYLIPYTGIDVQAETAGLSQRIGNTEQALPSKMNNDCSNISNQANDLISSLGMPSSRYIDIAVGADDTSYIAPAHGYFTATAWVSGGVWAQIYLAHLPSGLICSNMNGIGWNMDVIMPVRKDDAVKYHYASQDGRAFVSNTLKFVYAEGAQ